MKYLNNIKIITVFAALLVFMSCGGEDATDTEPTERELTIEALSGTWTLDASNSQFGNGLNDGAITSVTITSTGFTLSGDITSYIGGGSFSISDAGAFENAAITIASSDLELEGTPTVSLNSAKTTLTITFATKAKTARVEGLGSFKLVFVKAS